VLFSHFLCIGFGILVTILWQKQLKRSTLSAIRTQNNAKGNEMKKLQDSELMSLISEATSEFKKAKEKNENLQTAALRIGPQLIAKYPLTVMKHGKKLVKMLNDGGGIDGISDMFE